MEIPHHRDALDDLLAGHLQHQTQDAVRRRMLRPHVEDELFGLEPFLCFDDRKVDERALSPDLCAAHGRHAQGCSLVAVTRAVAR